MQLIASFFSITNSDNFLIISIFLLSVFSFIFAKSIFFIERRRMGKIFSKCKSEGERYKSLANKMYEDGIFREKLKTIFAKNHFSIEEFLDLISPAIFKLAYLSKTKNIFSALYFMGVMGFVDFLFISNFNSEYRITGFGAAIIAFTIIVSLYIFSNYEIFNQHIKNGYSFCDRDHSFFEKKFKWMFFLFLFYSTCSMCLNFTIISIENIPLIFIAFSTHGILLTLSFLSNLDLLSCLLCDFLFYEYIEDGEIDYEKIFNALLEICKGDGGVNNTTKT